MPSSSPFANFYDDVFLSATREQQESFLRQLFTVDASLCASFAAFVNPPLQPEPAEVKPMAVDAEVAKMQENIKRYRWDVLYDMDPTADDYISELVISFVFLRYAPARVYAGLGNFSRTLNIPRYEGNSSFLND